jgi:hypothetical protein
MTIDQFDSMISSFPSFVSVFIEKADSIVNCKHASDFADDLNLVLAEYIHNAELYDHEKTKSVVSTITFLTQYIIEINEEIRKLKTKEVL